MAGVPCDVAEAEQVFLAHLRIVEMLCGSFMAILCPRVHVINRPLWPVTVIHLQRQAACCEILLHALQCRGHAARDDAVSSFVPVQPATNEIVDGRVADVLNNGRIDITQEHEITRQRLGGVRPKDGTAKSCQ